MPYWENSLEARWQGVLINALKLAVRGQAVFPVSLSLRSPFDEEWIKIRDWTAEAKGHAVKHEYVLVQSDKRVRNMGKQLIPTGAKFENWESLLSCAVGAKARKTFFDRVIMALLSRGFSRDFLADLVSPLWKEWEPKVFEGAIKVVTYFQSAAFPDCFLRELPLEVHGKFIEQNALILRPLLRQVWQERGWVWQGEDWPKCLGIRLPPPMYQVRLLCDEMQSILTWPDNFLGVSGGLLAKAAGVADRIMVVENLTVLHTLPVLRNTLAIFGQGYRVTSSDIRSMVSNFKGKPVWYWGDIDAHGFHILSLLRQNYEGDVRSFLMDGRTLEAHCHAVGRGEFRKVDETFLNEVEKETYKAIADGPLRLEQERILRDWSDPILRVSIAPEEAAA
jgi:hypothetical protein